jgi:hypothetical protein
MNQSTKQPQIKLPKTADEITAFKENDMAQKGRTKHIVETDWPTQEAAPAIPTKDKKREIKKTQTARLP